MRRVKMYPENTEIHTEKVNKNNKEKKRKEKHEPQHTTAIWA